MERSFFVDLKLVFFDISTFKSTLGLGLHFENKETVALFYVMVQNEEAAALILRNSEATYRHQQRSTFSFASRLVTMNR